MTNRRLIEQALKKKSTNLAKKIREQGNKTYGADSFVDIEHGRGNVRSYYSTTLPPLDVILTGEVGKGFCAGKMAEILGEYDAGKTTIGLYVIREVQRQGGIGAVIDTEFTLTEKRVRELGIDPDRLIYVQEPIIEDVLEQVLFLIEQFEDSPAVIFWDTVASTRTKSGEGRKVGEGKIAAHASAMSDGLRRIVHPLAKSNTLLLTCNQRKDGGIGKIFATSREKDAALGGEASKFHSFQRMKLTGYKQSKSKGKYTSTGFSVVGSVLKSKISSGSLSCQLSFDTTKEVAEFNRAKSCLNTLKSWDTGTKRRGTTAYVSKSGKRYTENKFIEQYDKDSELRDEVHKELEERYKKRSNET